MDYKQFPRTMVGGVSLSRMVIGTNWILGWSHRSAADDKSIFRYSSSAEIIAEMLEVFLNHGIDTIMGLFAGLGDQSIMLLDAIKMAEDRTGRKMIIIDTPPIDVSDTNEARESANSIIKLSKELGSTFCFPHHSSTEQMMNKHDKTMGRLPDYLDMIRQNDMIPGLSAHMPEMIVYADLNEYDVATYNQIYNCLGFLMQIEIESVQKIIWAAKKPVMTIKSMAAGRCTPLVGLNFNWNTIRECDMVTVGCMNADEAYEDIEYSFAALERRLPILEGRQSPKKTDIIK